MSASIEQDYAAKERDAILRQAREQAGAPLRQRRERLRRTMEKVQLEAQRTEQAEQHRVAGELLKANLNRVPRGAAEVKLIDYGTGEALEVAVPLKPELSAADNLARHFRLYRRLSQGSARAAARLAELRDQLASVEAALAAIPTQTLEQLGEAPPPRARPSPTRGGPSAKLPYREFVAAGGRIVRVGRGAQENDTLSFKHARPNDLWLHARGLPGAHVVVPLQKGEAPPTELLLDACALAVHFSSAKGQDRVEVSYLPAKYLRKVKGAPGAVTYSQEKTLRYVAEPARIARLLASREE